MTGYQGWKKTRLAQKFTKNISSGCGLGLETYQRLVSRKIVNGSVSGGRRLGLGYLRLVLKTNFRPNCARHSTQCERASDVVNLYAVVTIAHHINTLKTTNVKDNI